MSIRTRVARILCVVATVGLAHAAGGAGAHYGPPAPTSRSPEATRRAPPETQTGFVLDRLSKRDLRAWRAIEEVAAATDDDGQPRSPTLRRLWDWAEASPHAIHVELVPRSKVANGVVGIFRAERADPTGSHHTAVIRLCPANIRHARVAPSPDAVHAFARFEGLTDVERYAEVLAHELAHAEYFMKDPKLFAQLEAAHRARAEFLASGERSIERVSLELRERLVKARVNLAATEAYAEPVEAAVLAELNGAATTRTAAAGSSR
jgi:hypothetical protein